MTFLYFILQAKALEFVTLFCFILETKLPENLAFIIYTKSINNNKSFLNYSWLL